MLLTAVIIRISLAVHWGTPMGIAFNEKTVAAQPIDTGVVRQRLLTDERVKGTSVLLDRLSLAAGATVRFEPSAKSLGWLQLLEGVSQRDW